MSDQFERRLREHLAMEAGQTIQFPRSLAGNIDAAMKSRRQTRMITQLTVAVAFVIGALLLGIAASHLRSLKGETQPAAANNASWKADLTLTGAVSGTVKSISVTEESARSNCSGRYSEAAGSWSSDFLIRLAGEQFHLEITVLPYAGPGTYSNSPSNPRGLLVLAYNSPTDDNLGWANDPSGPATFSVDPGDESGTLNATLTRNPSGDLPSDWNESVHVSGRWTCRSTT